MMKVTFLGTAGSVISAEKGFPSILIKDDLLLDCGEGTTQKLIRLNALNTISTICLTHMHGDHYLGISSLLWHLLILRRERELTIIGPTNTEKIIERLLSLTFLKEGIKALPFPVVFKELPSSIPNEELQGGYMLTYTEMDHTIIAFAYRIEKDGKVICYSGDTKPTQKLTQLANKSDLFICEATFLGRYASLAAQYGHSTPMDAAEMARDADCQKLALVHLMPVSKEALNESLTSIKQIFTKETVIPNDLSTIEL
ncbi:MAG: MBL fold metallo-hydrolase [Promethearchaeota archaeon]|jgi:ribonuclease BN (tRNA processing enzyme)